MNELKKAIERVLEHLEVPRDPELEIDLLHLREVYLAVKERL